MQLMVQGYTRADYERLPEGYPAELIDGMLVKEPSPTGWHQNLVMEIGLRLYRLVGRRRVLPSPTDVFLDDFNVLQPDVLVLAEEDRVGPDTGPVAIPILVVEVLSPSTASRDRDLKSATYLRFGVREVWLVDPDAETVEVRTRAGAVVCAAAEIAESAALPGFRLSSQALAS